MRSIKDLFSSGAQCLLANGFGEKQKDIALAVKMSTASLNDYLKGRREGDEGTRRRIAEHLGVSYEGLLNLGMIVLENEEESLTSPLFADEIKKILVASKDEPIPEFTFIPKYKARLSGGHGSFETSDQIEVNLAFRTEFVKSKGNPKKMALFEIMGDSMEPFLYDRDVILVDLQQNDPRMIVDGKAYAFREDNTIKVKRLSVQGRTLMATSENSQKYPPYEIFHEQFQLIGRVIWVGHEVR